MRIMHVALWSVLLASSVQSSVLAQVRALTVADIENAIDLGTHEKPDPYTIPMPPAPDSSAFGLAFTPFLRVQFLANTTWAQTGRRLTPGEISSSITAPVVHIATWLGNEFNELPCHAKPPRIQVFPKGGRSGPRNLDSGRISIVFQAAVPIRTRRRPL